MTLSFTQTINGKPNYFIEKIWAGLTHHFPFKEKDWFLDYEEMFQQKFGIDWPCTPATLGMPPEKIHTIREDKSNRWRPGMKIHPVINNRTPKRFQFAPVLECKLAQTIKIRNRNDLPMTSDHQWYGYRQQVSVKLGGRGVDFYNFYQITIDEKLLNVNEIQDLAINDGFDSVEDFFAYFNKDFTGKLIHWTDLKY